MPARSLTLDHLVIAARTLDEGVRHVAASLGIEPAGGGRHPLMRTHNALFGAWGGLYLEVIAIDPDASATGDGAAPPRARLFGLDDPAMQARL
ncbi:VOC family protein, partial [Burkholderia territorii]